MKRLLTIILIASTAAVVATQLAVAGQISNKTALAMEQAYGAALELPKTLKPYRATDWRFASGSLSISFAVGPHRASWTLKRISNLDSCASLFRPSERYGVQLTPSRNVPVYYRTVGRLQQAWRCGRPGTSKYVDVWSLSDDGRLSKAQIARVVANSYAFLETPEH